MGDAEFCHEMQDVHSLHETAVLFFHVVSGSCLRLELYLGETLKPLKSSRADPAMSRVRV
jgi:hypothetical protein